MSKRTDYITWDEYFMGVALLSGKRSKDPGTQVGACIVSNQNKIVGAGYNGLPSGCSDDDFSWEKQGDFLNTNIRTSVMPNSMPSSITLVWIFPGVEFTQRCFLATSAAKPSFSPASGK